MGLVCEQRWAFWVSRKKGSPGTKSLWVGAISKALFGEDGGSEREAIVAVALVLARARVRVVHGAGLPVPPLRAHAGGSDTSCANCRGAARGAAGGAASSAKASQLRARLVAARRAPGATLAPAGLSGQRPWSVPGMPWLDDIDMSAPSEAREKAIKFRRLTGPRREFHRSACRTQDLSQRRESATNPDSKRAGAGQKPPCGKTAIVSPRPEAVARKKLRFRRETGLPVPKRLEPELSSSGSGGRGRRPCFGGSGRSAGGRGRRSRQGLSKRDPRTPKMGPEDSQNAPREIPGA